MKIKSCNGTELLGISNFYAPVIFVEMNSMSAVAKNRQWILLPKYTMCFFPLLLWLRVPEQESVVMVDLNTLKMSEQQDWGFFDEQFSVIL